MAKEFYEMRFGGTGGQGMMFLGDVFAKAAGLLEGKKIILLKSYGPEARGGACRSELIVSDDPINYPALICPDFVLAMSQMACDNYSKDMDKENGLLLIDSGLVTNVPKDVKKVYAIPLTQIAVEKTGRPITANVVALGAISVLTSVASPEHVLSCVLDRFPEKLHEMNIKAYEAGIEAAKALL